VLEASPGRATLRFRVPVTAPSVRPQLPNDCSQRVLTAPVQTDSGLQETFAVRCERALAGRPLTVSGLGPSVSEAAVYYESPAGDSSATVLNRVRPSWQVPAEHGAAALDTALHYIRLGLDHIACGYDHLLFVALLVLVLQRPRAVLIAEGAFTCSHTLSYVATTWGWVRLPAAATEACIALSLVCLALDVDIRGTRRPPSLRSSIALALVFGLVHGLGFAGGLQDAGLPAAHAGVAALGFGMGVEVGQLACSGVALGVLMAAARTRLAQPLSYAATYGSGGIATYWLLLRLLAIAV